MYQRIDITTHGEGLYPLYKKINQHFEEQVGEAGEPLSGLLYIFCIHTSCALTISEGYDPSAKADLEEFLNRLAPKNLPYVQHNTEGPDDSPAHMKSALLHQHLVLPVERSKIFLGPWQEVFLAEFRSESKHRQILMKFLKG